MAFYLSAKNPCSVLTVPAHFPEARFRAARRSAEGLPDYFRIGDDAFPTPAGWGLHSATSAIARRVTYRLSDKPGLRTEVTLAAAEPI
jgi:hypothetical protein